MLLSIGLMVKNEEEYLESCLRGLVPILEAIDAELIVVDTGSTDRTVEIARRFTDKVYGHEWTNHFGDMRNTVISYTTGEWFFFVDGDEILEDASGVIEFFKSGDYRKYNSAFIQLDSLHRENSDDHDSFLATRFFRNTDDFKFVGAIHEQPVMRGPVAQIKGTLTHYGYIKDDPELMEYKFERNVALLRQELEKDPDNIYYLFQMSQSYGMYGKEKEALEYALKAYDLAKREGMEKHQDIGERLIVAYLNSGRFLDAERLCMEMLRFKEKNALDLYFSLGMAQAALGKYQESISNYRKYLTLLKDFREGRFLLGASRKIFSISKEQDAHRSISSMLYVLGKYSESLEHSRLIQDVGATIEHVPVLVDLYIKMDKFYDIGHLFEQWADQEKVLTALEVAIESKWLEFDEPTKLKLIEVLKVIDSDYGLLHLVRFHYYEGTHIGHCEWERIRDFNYGEQADYYGEFIFALIRTKQSIFTQTDLLGHDFLSSYALYLARAYPEARKLIYDFLMDDKQWADFPKDSVQRIKSDFAYGLLLEAKANDPLYRQIFDCFVECGIEFLEASFNVSILDNKASSWMRNGADGFLFYMRLARTVDKTSADYVRYLRLALGQDSSMKRGIDFMLKEVQEELANPELDELNELKKSVQATIKEAINAGELETAVVLINEYEDTVGIDAPLCSAKGIIYMIDGQLEEAEKVFLSGLELEPDNADLLYNLGYLRQYKGDLTEGVRSMDDTIEPRVLIGSPIRQKPAILSEFLDSLEQLYTLGLETSYLFIDDNVDVVSSEMLKKFSEEVPNVAIHVAPEDGQEYMVDEVTHRWKEELVWKVAAFKDMIIEIAKDFDFDYLFLIDSDLVLHPMTLQELINSNEDIISNVFWTRWHPGETKLPQVWLRDTYEQYYKGRSENIVLEEQLLRRQLFVNRLKKPGVYEVGGLGACTLISKTALHAGVKFAELSNVSFWGEDRHFCIRAVALGFELFVNTKYPAYHIYREADLEGVGTYKVNARTGKSLYKPIITLVQTNNSGSNTLALSRGIPENISNLFDVELISQNDSIEYYSKVMNSDVVIVTEGNYHFRKSLFNRNQIVIDLWHGFPIKGMGYADLGGGSSKALPEIWKNVDIIGSYSPLFNQVMERCIRAGEDKYVILGAPRNDLLIESPGQENLLRVLKDKASASAERYLIFMPTYRFSPTRSSEDGNKDWSNLFGFPQFDSEEFNRFLKANKAHLLVKLHPAEEQIYKDAIHTDSNVSLLTNQDLAGNDLDLYEILNATSVLITDYSSVYFDYMLLDRPIVFAVSDLGEYEKNRGFLLEPFEQWAPGPIVTNEQDLCRALQSVLDGEDSFSGKRNQIKSKVHTFSDAQSRRRFWNLLEKLLINKST